MFIDRRDKLGVMFDCIDLSFRLLGFSEHAIMECLLDELNMLRAVLVKKQNPILKALEYHDGKVQQDC